MVVCPCLYTNRTSKELHTLLSLFFFLRNLSFQIGGAAYLRVRLTHGTLRYYYTYAVFTLAPKLQTCYFVTTALFTLSVCFKHISCLVQSYLALPRALIHCTFVEIINPLVVASVDKIACKIASYCCCKY